MNVKNRCSRETEVDTEGANPARRLCTEQTN